MDKINFNRLTTNIMSINCNILDVSNRYGVTSYIDFIERSELQGNIMKGIDDFERPFIVFKTEIIYENTNFNKKTFTTFFQRYTDNLLLWHACGHDGPLLFDTIGGTNITQLKLLDDLLKNGYVDLNSTTDYEELKLSLNSKTFMTPTRIHPTRIYPTRIQLGYSE
jgi:hypothetical protein